MISAWKRVRDIGRDIQRRIERRQEDIENNIWKKKGKERKCILMKEWNQREKECEVCKCKMKIGHWSRHIRTIKHVEMMEKMMGGGDEMMDEEMKQRT